MRTTAKQETSKQHLSATNVPIRRIAASLAAVAQTRRTTVLPAAFLACVIGLQSAPSSQAYLEEYIPVSAVDKKRKVTLKTISDVGLKDGKALKIANAEMSLPAEGENVVFAGKDTTGKSWTLTKTYFGLGSAFFTTDLDQNGTTDIVVLQATGGCGIAPNAVLTTIMFDKQNKPWPTESYGYFSCPDPDWGAKSTTAVLDDLITIGTDKHAVLICQQLDHAEIKGLSHSYWRIPMYRANNCRWERVTKYNQNTVPMLVRYTNKGNKKVIPPPVRALREFEDLSFTKADEANCKHGTIRDVKLEEKRLKQLRIGAEVFAQPSWKYSQPFVIHITKNSTDLTTLDSDTSVALLQKAMAAQSEVRYSKSAKRGLAPTYIWITE